MDLGHVSYITNQKRKNFLLFSREKETLKKYYDKKLTVFDVQEFMCEYNRVPYEALQYMVGECNYGGKVTDQRDQRCLLSLLHIYLSPRVLHSKFLFANTLHLPTSPSSKGSHSEYMNALKVNVNTEGGGADYVEKYLKE